MKTKIELNADKDEVARIRQAIKDNDGYCPCVLTKTADTKCICKNFREQKVSGYCHCGLYFKIVEEDINDYTNKNEK